MAFVPLVPAPAGPPSIPPSADRAKPNGIKVPPERDRITYWSFVVVVAGGGPAVPVEEYCDECGGHTHTPAVTNPPSICALNPATGATVAAAQEYDQQPAGAVPAVKPSSRWHAPGGSEGYRQGTFHRGGTEQAVTWRRTQTEAQQHDGSWQVIAGPTWEVQRGPVVNLASYIMWTSYTVRPCNLDSFSGGIPEDPGFEPLPSGG